MPTIRMQHPVHGFTHAFDTGELEKLKLLGWSVETPQDPQKVERVVGADTDGDGKIDQVFKQPERKKPGPKKK